MRLISLKLKNSIRFIKFIFKKLKKSNSISRNIFIGINDCLVGCHNIYFLLNLATDKALVAE